MIELVLLGQYTSDSRLTMANGAGLTASVINNLANCITSTGSIGTLEIAHTIWDIIKATDWVLEDVASGNYEIMYLDAYNTIEIITIDDFSIDSFPDSSYTEGDPLDLLHASFALTYSSYNDSINDQDKYFGYGMPEYTRRGVSSSKFNGYTLTTSDTSVEFTLSQSDLEIVKDNVRDQSVILAHSLSDLSAAQNITVAEASADVGSCPKLYDPVLDANDTNGIAAGYMVNNTKCIYEISLNPKYLKQEYQYSSDGKLHGVYTQYRVSGSAAGKVKSTQDYVEGVKHGYYRYFDESGQQTNCILYENGNSRGSCM
jgi:hypothetical protein